MANSEVFRWNFSSNTNCEIKRSGFIIYISTIKYTYTHTYLHIFIQEAVNVSFNALNQKDVQNFAFKIFLLKVTLTSFSFQINFKCIYLFVYAALIGNFLFKTVKTKIIQKQSRI